MKLIFRNIVFIGLLGLFFSGCQTSNFENFNKRKYLNLKHQQKNQDVESHVIPVTTDQEIDSSEIVTNPIEKEAYISGENEIATKPLCSIEEHSEPPLFIYKKDENSRESDKDQHRYPTPFFQKKVRTLRPDMLASAFWVILLFGIGLLCLLLFFVLGWWAFIISGAFIIAGLIVIAVMQADEGKGFIRDVLNFMVFAIILAILLAIAIVVAIIYLIVLLIVAIFN